MTLDSASLAARATWKRLGIDLAASVADLLFWFESALGFEKSLDAARMSGTDAQIASACATCCFDKLKFHPPRFQEEENVWLRRDRRL